MKKLILKGALYSFLIVVALELLVRIFYLGKDNPTRFADEFNVEKWVPNQQGFSVTGNRRQNFSEYHINSSGFNSYREFTPTRDKTELAIVGDSYIQGFHQNYYNSIGKKIENQTSNIEVYEYGYAGYDFADQLHLIHAYKKQFDLIDHVIIGIDFSTDLTRGEYKVITDRLNSESKINRLLKKSKLIVYTKSIGVISLLKTQIGKLVTTLKNNSKKENIANIESNKKEDIKRNKEAKYLVNFESLVSKYGYDKKRFTLLLDSSKTSPTFLNYLKEKEYNYIDYSPSLKSSKQPTILVYDFHWNNHGRDLIAKLISEYIIKIKLNKQ